MGEYGRVQESTGEYGRVRESTGEYGRVRESTGEYGREQVMEHLKKPNSSEGQAMFVGLGAVPHCALTLCGELAQQSRVRGKIFYNT